MEPKKQKVLKKRRGRPNIYGEPTIPFSIAIPKSKKAVVKEFVEALLTKYRVKDEQK